MQATAEANPQAWWTWSTRRTWPRGWTPRGLGEGRHRRRRPAGRRHAEHAAEVRPRRAQTTCCAARRCTCGPTATRPWGARPACWRRSRAARAAPGADRGLRPTPAVLGAAFYLMEPVDGFNAAHAACRRCMRPTRCCAGAWAWRWSTASPRLHAGRRGGHRPVGFRPCSMGFLERQVPRWRKQLEGYAELARAGPAPVAARVSMQVGSTGSTRTARPSFVPGLLHGDFHIANVMFRHDGPELAAVVDWELATVGDPLLDLGWLLATWPTPRRFAPHAEPGAAMERVPEGARTGGALRATQHATSRPSAGMRCWPATSSRSSWRAAMRAPAPARHRERPATGCMRWPASSSSARPDGIDARAPR
jgi:aminoglycoside phosphotransferase (APT) family kinase protein